MDAQKKLIAVAVISLLTTGISSTFLFFHFRKNLQALQQQTSPCEALSYTSGSPVTRHAGESMWLAVQKQVRDTVVQVWSQTTEFNWIEPYKSPAQGEGLGSGFFINPQGDLITNYHVVAQASSVQIQIPSFGMERFDMEIVGVSPDRDIALLRITPETRTRIKEKLKVIPYLRLGDSDKVLRSQEVLALGYPLGQTRLKSTLGIVSGRERLGAFGYIQITAPLNPGNSGGPAVNTNGEVIGINSCGFPDAQNVGYIIPINEVRSALDDLYKVKLLRKPILGCLFQTTATADMVKYLGNPPDGGWYIAKVFSDSLLDSVGIKEKDMLYEINGYRVDIYGELNVPWSEDKVSLFELLNRYKVGDTIELVVYRNGNKKMYSFKLEQKHLPTIRAIYPEFEPEAKDYEVLGGMVIMELTFNHIELLIARCPELVRYSRSENQYEPVLVVTHILPNSQSYKARVLHRGSIIEKVNGEKAKTLNDFRDLALKSKTTGFITITTDENLLMALNVNKVLREEDGLAALYFYKKSKLIDDLMDKTLRQSTKS
ncbi:MAG: trypsin-like peptidase domain-containing protein [Candidatus Babeliales bacterium]